MEYMNLKEWKEYRDSCKEHTKVEGNKAGVHRCKEKLSINQKTANERVKVINDGIGLKMNYARDKTHKRILSKDKRPPVYVGFIPPCSQDNCPKLIAEQEVA